MIFGFASQNSYNRNYMKLMLEKKFLIIEWADSINFFPHPKWAAKNA